MLFWACAALFLSVAQGAPSFRIANDRFVVDGVPTLLKGGSFHYFRVARSHWADQLRRFRAMGLNTLETVIPWQLHEPRNGTYDFQGILDLAAFLKLAHQEGIMAMLRPGPYVCAQIDYGGFPPWLLSTNQTFQVRTYDPYFISHVDRYWRVLFSYIKQNNLLYADGGPVIMVQLENEFGSFGDVSSNPLDLKYMMHLHGLARRYLGTGVQLYTTDGGATSYMVRGTLNGSLVLTCGDFGPGSNSNDYARAFAAAKQFNPPGLAPDLVTEFYTAHHTHWGDMSMANASTTPLFDGIVYMMAMRASFSMFMGVGANQFGFQTGADVLGTTPDQFYPVTTSYEFNAPITIDGRHGYGSEGDDKFDELQAALLGGAPAPPAPPARLRSYGAVTLDEAVPLVASLPALAGGAAWRPVVQSATWPMEMLNQSYGFIAYQTRVQLSTNALLDLGPIRDRVYVYLDGQLQDTVERRSPAARLVLGSGIGSTLTLLVENMGRVDFGPFINDNQKGLLRTPLLNGKTMNQTWTTFRLPLEPSQLARLAYQPMRGATHGATFLRGSFHITGIAEDTWLTMGDPFVTGHRLKGSVFVNGVNIGRYWNSKGPQYSLYVPRDFLHSGKNTVEILELEGTIPVGDQIQTAQLPVWRT